MNVLILNEKYCDANPSLGLSNSFHNVLTTYSKAVDNNRFHVIHHDESYFIYGRHVDTFLLDYCNRFKIDVVITTILGNSPCNPSLDIYEKLKSNGVKLAWQWPDSGFDPSVGILVALEYSKFGPQFVWDRPRSPQHDCLPLNDNIVRLWVPQDRGFFKPGAQDIDVSFIGSTRYPDRAYFISEILKRYPEFVVRGGQREEGLGMEEYASLIRRSKISINFSLSPAGFSQTKGRVYEVLASNSLLLEYRNQSTREILTPDEDFLEFSNIEELLYKIELALGQEEVRKTIASSGHRKYIENYKHEDYWKCVFSKLAL